MFVECCFPRFVGSIIERTFVSLLQGCRRPASAFFFVSEYAFWTALRAVGWASDGHSFHLIWGDEFPNLTKIFFGTSKKYQLPGTEPERRIYLKT